MIYPIVAYGDPVLKQKAEAVVKDDIDIKKLAEDMFETMYQAKGIGLAAPQIGMSLRLFVVDGEPMEKESLVGFKKVFVNPEIINEAGEPWAFEEGCLSIPGIREDVSRPPALKMKYYDENWEAHEDIFEGLQARIIQHEYDHIQGILFTDHLSGFKKRLLKGKLANVSKGNVDVEYLMQFPQRPKRSAL